MNMLRTKVKADSLASIENSVAIQYPLTSSEDDLLRKISADLTNVEINSTDDALKTYFITLYALTTCRRPLLNQNKQREKLRSIAEKCLQYCKIAPVTSVHSHLFTRLYNEMAFYKLHESGQWGAVSEVLLGEYLGRDSKEFHHPPLFQQAQMFWKMGHLRLAKISLHQAIGMRSNLQRVDIILLLTKVHRLSGHPEQAHSLCYLHRKDFDSKSPVHERLHLEQMLSDLASGEDPKSLVNWVRSDNKKIDAHSRNIATLWLFASPYKEIWKSFGGLKNHKLETSTELTSLDDLLKELIATLEALYDREVPLEIRLRDLLSQIANPKISMDPEWHLLFLAGAIRWLNRHRQQHFAAILLEEYRSLSLKYSEGSKSDCLTLMTDITDEIPITIIHEESSVLTKINSSLSSRLLKYSQIAMKAAFRIAKMKLSHLSPEERHLQHEMHLIEMFEDIELMMESLKGPVMKFGQLFANSNSLPQKPKEVMRRIFSRERFLPFEEMLTSIPPESRELFHNIFEFINPKAVAGGSFSQVYHGELKDGTDVAVKLLFPKIEAIISSEKLIGKLFAPFWRQLLDPKFLHDMSDAIGKQLTVECNLLAEVKNQQVARSFFENDPDIYIPKVFESNFGPKVMISEYIKGIRLDEYISYAHQENRNRIARQLARFWIKSILEFGVINFDTHLANFIVRDHQLVVIDFGAYMPLNEEMKQYFKETYLARYRNDDASMYRILASFGIIDQKRIGLEEFKNGIGTVLLQPFGEYSERPYYHEHQLSWVRQLANMTFENSHQMNGSNFFAINTSPGHADIYQTIGAVINWNELLGEILCEIRLLQQKNLMIG